MQRRLGKCQGYEYEANPSAIANALKDARKQAARESAQSTLYGKLAVDFFSCQKQLVSGVTLRISLRRSQDDFATISEAAGKNYKVKVDEANRFVRKLAVSDNVVGALEKTLLRTPAIFQYIEVITKTFLATMRSKVGSTKIFLQKNP